MTEERIIRLEIPRSAKYVAVARNIVDSLSNRIPLSQEELEDLKLAVGEACANAIKFSSPKASWVQVLFSIKDDRIEVEVRNKGTANGRTHVEPVLPPPENMQEGGMGMFIIRRLTDNMKIDSRNGVTKVKMAKKFPRPLEEQPAYRTSC